MKKLLAALTVALLATVSIGAHATDWSTVRFGVDA
ncbi:MAG: ABC transporter substrate-binding protein, partial [Paraburkholderia nemoris]